MQIIQKVAMTIDPIFIIKFLASFLFYFIVGYLMFAYMLKDFIYSLFFVPYMIFSLCCAVYLVLPSRYNKGRANWESIVVLLRADRAVYRPYAEQEVDDA